MSGGVKMVGLQLHHSRLVTWASCGKSCGPNITFENSPSTSKSAQAKHSFKHVTEAHQSSEWTKNTRYLTAIKLFPLKLLVLEWGSTKHSDNPKHSCATNIGSNAM